MIANELHMNLDLKFMCWDIAIQEIIKGNADILMTCDYSDSFDGVDKLLKSEPVSSDDFLIYSKEKISSPNILYGNRIGVMKDGNVMAEINKMQLQKYCIEYSNNRQALIALINDEVDFAVMRQTVGTVLLKELSSSNIEGYISIGQSKMCFGINSSKPELLEKINTTLEKLKINGDIEKLRTKWLTTFVKPYTIPEILSKNTWVDLTIILLILVTAFFYIKETSRKRKTEEERFRSSQIVQWLTQDFSCLNYVELTDNPQKDPVINYRISETLRKLIPGWEEEKKFSNKLDLLRDNLIYKPDRKQFDENTKRYKVIEELLKNGVYYVNTRVFINKQIKYYQMKFSGVFHNRVLKGMVAGLHSVDDQIKKEMDYQQQLQEALKNAQVANKAKTDFLFNMSHDIRTPLNAIKGFTNMAIEHIDDKNKALECLNKTQQSGNLLLSLINGVLDVSKIESGEAVFDYQNGNILSSFSNIESTMYELASANKVKLSFDFKNIKDKYVYCDFNRCNRIFVNIISNAIKYNKKNGYVKVKCEQLTKSKKGYATYCYTFEDNGIGMSEEFQKHLFEKFSRENNISKKDIQGTGLGMAVCKSFVELMNGTIECKSKLNKGTTIKVTLPFKLQEKTDFIDSSTDLNISPEKNKIVNKSAFLNKKILIADDSELNLEITEDILLSLGFIVDKAANGKEVLEILNRKGPDYYSFILMDIRMPLMDGYTATKEIRKKYPNSKIPIIALSANAFEEDKADSLASGMDGHVAKPIDKNSLYNALINFI